MLWPYKIFAQVDPSPLPQPNTDDTISTTLSLVFAVTAALAVLIIVIAGFRYIISRGDSNAVAQAKNTIIYAVVGLVVSLAAFSVVTFVISKVGG